MTTPGKPRQSGIPTPGRTGIPTPGRSRSVSSVPQSFQASDAEYMTRALADAIKANDPAQHRISQTESQSSSPHFLQSGRRSVAERHSIARPPERAKTPVAQKPISRPPSRHSDAFAKTINRQFEVGDSVRIDTLSLEGTLRYAGEIEGKNGIWAGIELNGQFVGKGKNNGSVNGIQYFSCPENCGVFVATTKLSPGRFYQPNVPRPPSVASSRNGRATPSFSGRGTPSLSTSRAPSLSLSSGRMTPSFNGRITPSSSTGRVTPGVTPSAKTNYLSRSTIGQKNDPKKLPEKITPGSRAAKYANMTAKQLSSRKEQTASPIRQMGEHGSNIPSSPSPISRTLSSPSRPPGSPFSTPKPGLNGRMSSIGSSLPSTRGRSAHNTPRGRIPSAIAMPPPASPISSASRSISLSQSGPEELSLTNLGLQGKALQERIALLMTDSGDSSSVRPESSSSSHSGPADDRILELQARIEALEGENGRLRSEKDESEANKQTALIHKLEEDHNRIADDNTRLTRDKDELLKAHEATLADLRDSQELHHSNQQRIDELEKQLTDQRDESQRTVEALNGELADVILGRQKLEQENQILQDTKADFITQVDELATQVDELRIAGQETIALYEERLSTANTQRYDLECRVADLEKGATNQETMLSANSSHHISATEIDNESLRDQVLYLQKKIATMEDLVEESRLASEKEESAVRERMRRLKEKEESMKLELTEGLREVERMAKAEANARGRVEEIEEALRESQVALENARAEIESLRAELAVSAQEFATHFSDSGIRSQGIDGLQDGSQPGREKQHGDLKAENLELLKQNNELLTQIANLTSANDLNNSASSSKTELPTTREEVTGLKHIVQELQKEHSIATQKIKLLESENQILKSETQLLQSEAEHLRQEIQILESNLDINTNDNPEAEGSIAPNDTEAMKRQIKEQKARYEVNSLSRPSTVH
ncbi:hypothetical protein P691DRAFT_188428 [Macrolepiota fuliginosa MF-IS2]|uniref:CAP-Gly domain-containing protein n=1 Tax=Macrolepiota fuliginosa MF-IS2 TaxID=1400762 RepID=A0A9P5X873_9AGAR|nr:hypothetical protein P691DRAFT_188428 [Macrolepiota fuliginosa MF-IS2]